MAIYVCRRLSDGSLFAGFTYMGMGKLEPQWVDPKTETFAPLISREASADTLADLKRCGVHAVWCPVTING